MIETGAKVETDTRIGTEATVERGARIEADCTVGDGARVMTGAILREHTRLESDVQVQRGALIDAGSIIQSGHTNAKNEPARTEEKVIRGGNKRAGEREAAPATPARSRG